MSNKTEFLHFYTEMLLQLVAVLSSLRKSRRKLTHAFKFKVEKMITCLEMRRSQRMWLHEVVAFCGSTSGTPLQKYLASNCVRSAWLTKLNYYQRNFDC